jgi:hypothetical protein
MVKSVRYRVEQFLRALTARHAISEQRIEQATRDLTPEARALFAQQPPQDQRHALAVYETLCQEGHTHQDLLAAALLHDAGKAAAQLPAWQRGMFVLVERFVPRVLDHAIRGQIGSCRRPLADYAGHAEIGARWAEEAGCSPLTVALIRRHKERLETCQTEEDRLLATLRAADCAN